MEDPSSIPSEKELVLGSILDPKAIGGWAPAFIGFGWMPGVDFFLVHGNMGMVQVCTGIPFWRFETCLPFFQGMKEVGSRYSMVIRLGLKEPLGRHPPPAVVVAPKRALEPWERSLNPTSFRECCEVKPQGSKGSRVVHQLKPDTRYSTDTTHGAPCP